LSKTKYSKSIEKMKTFREFCEQVVGGRLQPATPQQIAQQRSQSVKRATTINRQLRTRNRDELDAHQANMRTLLKKSDEDIRGSH